MARRKASGSTPSGRLELTWSNKNMRLLSHGADSYEWVDPADWRVSEVRLLEPVADIGQGDSGNLLIQGDALRALTALTALPEYAERYVGKVKLCYIDPPFNTGKAFKDYDDAVEHSVWLTMLRDRLLQIRQLLSPDGSVWVHLDLSEEHRARAVLDELFGASNYLGTVVWEKADSPRNDLPNFSVDHDTIVAYGRSSATHLNKAERDVAFNAVYRSLDGDPVPWHDDNPTAPSAIRNQTWVYAIQSPVTGTLVYPAKGRCWASKQETIFSSLSEYANYELRVLDDDATRADICGVAVQDVRKGVPALMLTTSLAESRKSVQRRKVSGPWPDFIIRQKGTIGRKRHQPVTGMNTRTLWLNTEVGHNREAKAEIKALFPGLHPFATPKPERLLQKIIATATAPGDIVLDCFAGSGTTASVAHKMGRRWVTAELSGATLRDFVVPRLTKVVEGQDLGGVTTTVQSIFEGDLPDGAADAHVRKAAPLLVALGEHGTFDDIPGVTPEVVKKMSAAMRSAAKTRKKTTIGWQGGGGFQTVLVGPSMFEDVDGTVVLADWATGGALAEAVTAQLKYRFEPDGPFSGRKGRSRLAVLAGMLTAVSLTT